MRKQTLIGIFFMLSLPLVAQQHIYRDFSRSPKTRNYQEIDMKALHFGFTIGFNATNFHIQQSAQKMMEHNLEADVVNLYPGFHVNIITDWRLGDDWSLRFLPGLLFTQRNIIYYDLDGVFDADMKLESNLLDFPLLVKYSLKGSITTDHTWWEGGAFG